MKDQGGDQVTSSYWENSDQVTNSYWETDQVPSYQSNIPVTSYPEEKFTSYQDSDQVVKVWNVFAKTWNKMARTWNVFAIAWNIVAIPWNILAVPWNQAVLSLFT